MRCQRRAMDFGRLSTAAGAVLLAGVTLTTPAVASPGRTLVAAPDGHGAACSVPHPCALESASRRLAGEHGDVTVLLRGGTYRLNRTLELPRTAAKVTFRAAPGETPVLTGARRVTGFTRTDPARGIYTASVPRGTDTRQLFVD